MNVDESKFPYGYVPEHLKERVQNWEDLTTGERLELTHESSVAAWAKIGVVRDPTKPMDKTIRRVERSQDWGAPGPVLSGGDRRILRP